MRTCFVEKHPFSDLFRYLREPLIAGAPTGICRECRRGMPSEGLCLPAGGSRLICESNKGCSSCPTCESATWHIQRYCQRRNGPSVSQCVFLGSRYSSRICPPIICIYDGHAYSDNHWQSSGASPRSSSRQSDENLHGRGEITDRGASNDCRSIRCWTNRCVANPQIKA